MGTLRAIPTAVARSQPRLWGRGGGGGGSLLLSLVYIARVFRSFSIADSPPTSEMAIPERLAVKSFPPDCARREDACLPVFLPVLLLFRGSAWVLSQSISRIKTMPSHLSRNADVFPRRKLFLLSCQLCFSTVYGSLCVRYFFFCVRPAARRTAASHTVASRRNENIVSRMSDYKTNKKKQERKINDELLFDPGGLSKLKFGEFSCHIRSSAASARRRSETGTQLAHVQSEVAGP